MPALYHDAASPARYIRPATIPAEEINALARQVDAYLCDNDVGRGNAGLRIREWFDLATRTNASPDWQKFCLRHALIEIRCIARWIRRAGSQ